MESPEDEMQNRTAFTTSVAVRIDGIFSRCRSFRGNRAVWEEWARTYGLKPPNEQIPNSVTTEVARQLSIVELQLDQLHSRISAELPQLSHGTGVAQVDRLRILVAEILQNLSATWANHEKKLTPDLMQTLRLLSELLPFDEQHLDSVGLEAVRRAIQDLRSYLESCENPTLKELLLKLVGLMEQAVIDYAVGGERALARSVREAWSGVLESVDELQASSSREEVTRFVLVWKQFVALCEPLIFADRLIAMIYRATDATAPLLRMLT